MFFSKTQNKEAKAQQFLARLADQQTVDRIRIPEDRRAETRTVFQVGVWVIPIAEATPEISMAFVALTKDVTSKGLSIVTNRSIPTQEALVVFSDNFEATFLRAKVCNRKHRGLGWLQLGLEVTGIVTLDECPALKRFTNSAMF